MSAHILWLKVAEGYKENESLSLMTPINGSPRAVTILLSVVSLTFGQGLSPTTPSKEYIRLGGQVIAIENAPLATAPAVQLSPNSLTFASQTVATTSAEQTITVKNSGTTTLSISSIALSGTNPGDFSKSSTCGTSVAVGASCLITVAFKPLATGTRSATVSIVDNATGSPHVVNLSGTGASGSGLPTPTTFTTYLGTYGSPQPSYNGASIVLALRAYVPAGTSQLTYLVANFNSTATGATEYAVWGQTDGAGGYTLRMQNSSGSAPAWPFLTMNASGATITLPTPITLGAATITAYRFAFVGYEVQLDLTIKRNDTFSDQIVVQAQGLGNGPYYSDPWAAVDGAWSSSAAAQAVATLSTTAVNFGNEQIHLATTSQTVAVTNTGNAPLSISSVTVGGADASDFTASNGCTAGVAPGGTCNIAVTFDPLSTGARTATLTIVSNASNSVPSVTLSGTGFAPTPTTFTTYLGTYGTGFQTFTGATVVLPLRGYIPSGVAQMQYFWANLSASSGGATEYQIYAISDGAGSYVLHLYDGTNNAPAWPFLTMNANGTTVTLATPITLGTLQITAYRFALVGNEFQLDVTVKRSGTFSDQVILFASYGSTYSAPWNAVDGQWSTP